MAIKAVEIFLKHTEEYSDETRQLVTQYGSPLQWPGFTFASTPEESKRINETKVSTLIISSSGMVTGGRIQHHLMQRLPDPKNTVLFIGFRPRERVDLRSRAARPKYEIGRAHV